MEGGIRGKRVVEPMQDFPIIQASHRSAPEKGAIVAAGSGADGGFSGEGLGLGLVTGAFQEQLPILLLKEWFKMSPIQRILWMITHLPHFLKSLQRSLLITSSLGCPQLLCHWLRSSFCSFPSPQGGQ